MRNLTREQLLAELRALQPQFEREGVAHMTLFGSRARGDHRPDSDVDLVIDVEPARQISLLDIAHLYGIIEDATGLESSILTRGGLRDAPEFAMRIAPDEMRVF